MRSEPPESEETSARGQRGEPGDPLRLVLQSMEAQLDDRVDEVSEAKPARDESTEELIRLEETLSSAQDKAKQLVTLRLKLGDEESPDGNPDRKPGPSAAPRGSRAAEPPKGDLEEE